MTRTQFACYLLVASAVVLSGLLIVQTVDRFENDADAAMVVNRGTYTVLSARRTADAELICFLDNSSGRMVAYTADISAKTIRPIAILDVGEQFSKRLKGRSRGGTSR